MQKPFKSSHDRVPAVPENVDPQGASLSTKVEVSTRIRYPSSPSGSYRGAQETPHLPPSNNNRYPATSEIPSGSVNQWLPGAPASQVFLSNTLFLFSNFGDPTGSRSS
jgi:hypothetical protein